MRELAIAETLLDEVMTLVRDWEFTRVTGIEIAAGEAAGADPDALGRILNDLSRGTPAEGARIRIIPERLRVFCSECLDTFPAAVEGDPCPICGRAGTDVITGLDVMLVDLVGEREPAGAVRS